MRKPAQKEGEQCFAAGGVTPGSWSTPVKSSKAVVAALSLQTYSFQQGLARGEALWHPVLNPAATPKGIGLCDPRSGFGGAATQLRTHRMAPGDTRP